jgi:hypothetical protein
MAPAIPGDHDMRINKGLLLVISPKIATTWSVNKISRAAIPQLKPKVIARKGIRVLVFMILSPWFYFDDGYSLKFYAAFVAYRKIGCEGRLNKKRAVRTALRDQMRTF